jgi:hypothetical protein
MTSPQTCASCGASALAGAVSLCEHCRGRAETWLAPENRIIGGLELRRLIGAGATGFVFEAWQADLARFVAVKILPGAATDPHRAARFLREARIAAGLRHPGIVTVHDCGRTGDASFLMMELIDGRSLDKALADGPLPIAEAARIARDAALALHAAHCAGVIHRDVKPSNLMLQGDGRVRVLDFGLARGREDPGLTLQGTVLGTPHYMSPEQAFSSPDEVDARTDVYSLGAVLYEALGGRRPHGGTTMLAVLRSLDEQDPSSLRTRRAEIPAELDAVVQRAMAKDRGDRFPDAATLAETLAPWQNVIAVPRTSRSRSRRLALAGGATLLTALGAWIYWPNKLDAGPDSLAAAEPSDSAAWWRAAEEAADPVTRRESLRTVLGMTAFAADADSLRLHAFAAAGLNLQRASARDFDELLALDPGDHAARTSAALARLAGSATWLSFLGIELFPLPAPEDAAADATELHAQGAPPAFASLLNAAAYALWGAKERAEEGWKTAAAQGADPVDIAFLRVLFRLRAAFPVLGPEADPGPWLALADELDSAFTLAPHDPRLRSLAAIAAARAGAADRSAREVAILLALSPDAAETHVVRCVLDTWNGRYEAASANLEAAQRLDAELDTTLHELWLRTLLVGREPGWMPQPEERAWMDEWLAARADAAERPAQFLCAWYAAGDADWATAARRLNEIGWLDPARLALPDEFAAELAGLAGWDSQPYLLLFGAYWQQHLERWDAAAGTCRELLKLCTGPAASPELDEEERAELSDEARQILAGLDAAETAETE